MPSKTFLGAACAVCALALPAAANAQWAPPSLPI